EPLAGISSTECLTSGIKSHTSVKGALLVIARNVVKQIADFTAFLTGELKILQRCL
ncbi:uncharacterized protein METZ01_LOCUS318846, partial [marine metagenome]